MGVREKWNFTFVDDIFSWAKSREAALFYIECQLRVCQSYWLSLSLRKSHNFPKSFKFVGINVCLDRNHPAMSKHQLLEHWPQPEIFQDIANIVGFAQFYSKFIPQFELCIARLCDLTTKFKYTERILSHHTRLPPRICLRTWRRPSYWVHAFSASIINGSLCSCQISHLICPMPAWKWWRFDQSHECLPLQRRLLFYVQDIHGCSSSSFILC